MHIGIAGPVTLAMLRHLVDDPESLAAGYAFPSTASLVLGLRERGHELSVFALDTHATAPTRHEGDRLTIHVTPMRPRARHRARDLFAVERHGLARAMRESGCDVIHAHWTYEFALGAQRAGLPLVVTAHDSPLAIARLNKHPYWWIRAGMAAAVVSRSRTLTAVAPPVAMHLRRVYGYRRPIRLVPNGIPVEIFAREVARPPDQPLFVSVAQGWGALKNVQTAIEAFAQVRREHPEARFVLMGSGYGQGEEAQEYAAAAGLTAGCEFRGAVTREEVLTTLAGGATALVHPSRFEAHSVAVSEAMALGLCVIGGRASGGMPWTLDDGRAGLLVDIQDARALASAMSRVVDDARLRETLGSAARSHAATHYALPVVVGQYEDAYAAARAASA